MLGEWAVWPLATLIGVMLGALGSGGAILSLPVLVYAAGLPVLQAVAVSQVVIGIASAMGTALHARKGNVEWREVLLFAGTGIPATKLGALLASRLPPRTLMLIFAAIVLASGLRLFLTADALPGRRRWLVALIMGVVVGVLTGMLGVGGGFLLAPAMIAFAGLSARKAMASTLPVIALNSLTGAATHISEWWPVAWLAGSFLLATLMGAFLGIRLAREMSEKRLKQALASMLIVIGFWVGAVNSLP